MTHAEFARETLRPYHDWRAEDLCRTQMGHHTPQGWHAEIHREQIYVWGPGDDWLGTRQPPFKASVRAIHRQIVAEAKIGAKQLSLF